MRQIREAEVRPKGFGHVDDDVAGVIPRSEDADLGLPLRPNGAFKEANARVASSGIGEHAQRRAGEAIGRLDIFKPQFAQGGFDFARVQSRRVAHLFGREAVPAHVAQPVGELCVIARRTGV